MVLKFSTTKNSWDLFTRCDEIRQTFLSLLKLTFSHCTRSYNLEPFFQGIGFDVTDGHCFLLIENIWQIIVTSKLTSNTYINSFQFWWSKISVSCRYPLFGWRLGDKASDIKILLVGLVTWSDISHRKHKNTELAWPGKTRATLISILPLATFRR